MTDSGRGESFDARRRRDEVDVDLEPMGDDDEFIDPADRPVGDDDSGRVVAPEEDWYDAIDPEAAAHDLGGEPGAVSAEATIMDEQD